MKPTLRLALPVFAFLLLAGCSVIDDLTAEYDFGELEAAEWSPTASGINPKALARDAERPLKIDVPDESRIPSWPPVLGETYPDLRLQDSTGAWVSLSDFKGKVLLIEPVGMTCQGCIAMAGGNKPSVGAFAGIPPQKGYPSVKEMMGWYSKVELRQAGLIYIQLLLYNLDMMAPTAEDAAMWQEHFASYATPNTVVLAGHYKLIGPESFAMIPGLQLVDRDMIFRYWVTNEGPHSHSELLESIHPLLRRAK